MSELVWKEHHADRCVAYRADAEGVRVGSVQRFGSAWFWEREMAPHWFGPVDNRAEAQLMLERDLMTVSAQPSA